MTVIQVDKVTQNSHYVILDGVDEVEALSKIQALQDETQVALDAITFFTDALQAATERGQVVSLQVYPSDTQGIFFQKKMIIMGLVIGVVSVTACSLVIPLILNDTYDTCSISDDDWRNDYNCFEAKATKATADIFRKHIMVNANQTWGRNIIDGLGSNEQLFLDQRSFIKNLKVTCEYLTLLGTKIAHFSFELHVPGRLTSGVPAAGFGFAVAGSAVGTLGTYLVEMWGWKPPPLSISEFRLLRSHLSKFKEFIQYRNNPNADQLLENPSAENNITVEQVETALQNGNRVREYQIRSYAYNLASVVYWIAIGIFIWQLTKLSIYSSRAIGENYEWNTYERFPIQPGVCTSHTPRNFTFQSHPIVGGQNALHDATSEYPGDNFYDHTRDCYLAATLATALPAPVFSLLGKIPNGLRLTYTAGKATVVYIRTKVNEWRNPQGMDQNTSESLIENEGHIIQLDPANENDNFESDEISSSGQDEISDLDLEMLSS